MRTTGNDPIPNSPKQTNAKHIIFKLMKARDKNTGGEILFPYY